MDNRPLFILFFATIFFFTPLSCLYCQQVATDTAAVDSSRRTTSHEVNFATDTISPSLATFDSLVATDSLKTDSLATASKKTKRHSAKKAALFSAVLPGLGQAYNKKYWKIPIVYAGLGGLGYAIYYTATNFYGYRNAYRKQVATVPDPFASYNGISDASELKEYRDYFKRNMDIASICTGVWYLLNIVDAAVDGHLFDWNMRDDLNAHWQPTVITGYSNYNTAAAGVKVTLNF